MNAETKEKELDEKLNEMKTESYFVTLILIGTVFAINAVALGVLNRVNLLGALDESSQVLVEFIQANMLQGLIIGVVWVLIGFLLLIIYRSQKAK